MTVVQRSNPYTESGLRASFFKLITKLVNEGAVTPGQTFHGSRHTVGTKLAEVGADEFIIMIMLGYKSPDIARRYTPDTSRNKRGNIAIKVCVRS